MPAIDLSILNQRQTPAFYADVFANRPAAGFVGRIFVSTNTFAFYRDNGTGWDLIGGPGTGTITGSGTAGTVPLWNGASTIGDSTLIEGSTKFTTTKDIQADAFYLNGMTAGSGALYWTSDRVTLANYNPTGKVEIEVAGGVAAQTINADLSTLFYGNIIRNGGTSSQFLKADGSLDSSAYVTTNIYNGNGTLSAERTVSLNGHNLIFDGGASVARVRLDADTDVARIFSFATNNVARWAFRIDDAETGSNAGSNFAVRRYDDAGAFVDSPLLINRATGQSTFAKKVVIENNAGDQQLQIVSTTAPSLRIDNLQTGATKRVGLGLSTNVNNFIQGSVDQDFCIFNSSTTASPILFGIYDAGLTNTQEAARISAARNFIVGKTTDSGERLQINGTGIFTANNAALTVQSLSNTGYASLTFDADSRDYVIGVGGSSAGVTDVRNNFYVYDNTAGQVRFRIDTTGAATFSNTLTSYGALYVGQTGVTNGIINSNDGMYFNIDADASGSTPEFMFGKGRSTAGGGGTTFLTIANTGNVLIGTTTDAGYKLNVSGKVQLDTLGAGAHVIKGSETNGGNAPTECANTDTTTSSDASPGLNINKYSATTSSNARFIQFYAGNFTTAMGGIVGNGASNVQFATLSDIREKENIDSINNSLEKLLQLNPVKFDWIKTKEHVKAGFIAQEVEKVFPEFVIENFANEGEEERKAITGGLTSGIVAHIIKAIQELNTKIENIK